MRISRIGGNPNLKFGIYSQSWFARRFPVGHGNKRCRDCGGRGMVSVMKRHRALSGKHTIEIGRVCDTCDGTGRVRPDRKKKGE